MNTAVKKIRIGNIKVRARGEHLKLNYHPYYISLKRNDKNEYEKYCNKSKHQRAKESGDWNGYLQLVKSIKNKGFIFDIKHPVIIKYKRDHFYVTHGRHRMCILRFLFHRNSIVQLKCIGKDKFVLIRISNN